MEKNVNGSLEVKAGCSVPETHKEASKNYLIVLLSIALVVITLSVYWQVGDHEFLNYDDNLYVTANPHIASGITWANIVWAFTSVDAANWHPITWLSHMSDIQLYDMNPRGHHLTNVAIHAISSLLLMLLLFRLTGALWQSTFVAALFALHPLHVESVAWVAERKDVLSGFFWFLTFFFYSGYVTKQKPVHYILALSSFVVGLMSKPMLVTLPLVMLIMDYWPLNRYRHEGLEPGLGLFSGKVPALVREKIPFLACSVLSAVVTIYAQHKGNTIASLDAFPFDYRIENALISCVKYIILTFWPHNLALFYPASPSLPPWQVICSLLVLFSLSAATIWGGRRYPYLAVGWYWFLITLVPVIGLIQVGVQSMADRYSYIPIIGLFIMAAWGVPELTKKLQHQKRILSIIAVMAIAISAVLTWYQVGYWQDDCSLFGHSIQVTTDNYIAHNNLGDALLRRGDIDAAINEFEEALRINQNSQNIHNNLGVAFFRKGYLDEAIIEYQKAIMINPEDITAQNNLKTALDKKHEISQFKK